MKLHRDLNIRQATAWFMLHRIREAFADVRMVFDGPVEVDESYFGGLERNKHESKKLRAGRGPVGKTAVVGMKDRVTKRVAARVVDRTDKATLQGLVHEHAAPGAKVYTDETGAYKGLENHETVNHGVGEYVRGMGPYQRRRVVLEHVEARPQGHLPQDVSKAPSAVRQHLRGPAERAGYGHPSADATRSRRDDRPAAHVQGPDGMSEPKKLTEEERLAKLRQWDNTPSPNPRYKGRDAGRLGTCVASPETRLSRSNDELREKLGLRLPSGAVQLHDGVFRDQFSQGGVHRVSGLGRRCRDATRKHGGRDFVGRLGNAGPF